MTDREREREIRKEAAAYRRFATRHHAEHTDERDADCSKCQKAALHEWAEREGYIPTEATR